jgi:hypothetical protein
VLETRPLQPFHTHFILFGACARALQLAHMCLANHTERSNINGRVRACGCAGGKSFSEEQSEPSTFDAATIDERTKVVYAGKLTSLVETDVTNYVLRESGAKHGPPRVLLLIGGSVQTLGELDAFHAAGGIIVVAEDSGGLAGCVDGS